MPVLFPASANSYRAPSPLSRDKREPRTDGRQTDGEPADCGPAWGVLGWTPRPAVKA